MQDPWGAGTGKDATPPQGFFKTAVANSKPSPKSTPHLAPQTAGRGPRQVVGLQPSKSPVQVVHDLLNLAGINPKAILHNAAVVGSSTLPPQAGVKPHGTVEQAGIPIIGPGGLAHAGALGILPFKRLLGRAAEDVVAKEAPKVAVPEFAKAIHPRAVPKVAGAKTLNQAAVEALPSKAEHTAQEALRAPDRFNRQQEYGKILQQNPTLEGHIEARKALAGKYAALHYKGFDQFSPEATNAMIKDISEHPDLGGFDKQNAIEAIRQALNGKYPTPSETKLLRTALGDTATSDIVKSVQDVHRLKALGYDIANIPRSIMASFDASGLLRQSLLLLTGHPVVWAKNVPVYLKAIVSDQYANKALEAIHSRENAVNGYYDKIGLDFTSTASQGAPAIAREEPFRSTFAEKIPGVKQSGRGFTVALDKGRADLADIMQAKAAQMDGKTVSRIRVVDGKPKLVKEVFDQNDPRLLKSIGTVANSATGRGSFGKNNVVANSEEGLNLLFFSPKLAKSRVDFINPYWYAKLDPLARHEAYRAMGGLVALVATADGIAKAVGAGVNLDPRSSDFAKIKLGDTRLDLAGGFQQYIRILSELATQQVVNSQGKTTDLGQAGAGRTSDWDVTFRFIRSKLAPLSGAAVDVQQRQNAVGQPLTFSNSILSRVTPLAGQDAYSVGTDTANRTGNPLLGALAGVGAFGLSAFGGGVQNYKPKAPKNSGSGGDPWGAGGGGNSGGDPWGASP